MFFGLSIICVRNPAYEAYRSMMGWPTLDHYVPRKAGGSDELANLVLACFRCNNDKGSLHPDDPQFRAFLNLCESRTVVDLMVARVPRVVAASVPAPVRDESFWWDGALPPKPKARVRSSIRVAREALTDRETRRAARWWADETDPLTP
jgi:hypothetical protein